MCLKMIKNGRTEEEEEKRRKGQINWFRPKCVAPRTPITTQVESITTQIPKLLSLCWRGGCGRGWGLSLSPSCERPESNPWSLQNKLYSPYSVFLSIC